MPSDRLPSRSSLATGSSMNKGWRVRLMKGFELTVLVKDSIDASDKALGLEAEHGLSIIAETPELGI